MKHRASRCEIEAWLALTTWALLIYVTVPVMGTVQIWVRDTFGPGVFLYGTIVALLLGLGASVVAGRRVVQRLDRQALAWLSAVAGVAVAWAIHLRAQPQEAVHLIEYGVLGLLAANALRHRTKNPTLFVQATLIGATIGVADELVQWATPGRYFDFRDIWLNAGAVALVQIGLWKGGIVPTPGAVSTASLRRTLRLAVAFILLLGLVLSLTPAAVEAIAGQIPIAASLIDHEDAVAEFGHSHDVPGIGRFKSRFSLNELHEIDRNRGAEIGAETLPASHGGLYPRFLESASRAQHPFGREARLHINSRNRNLKLARNASTPEEKLLHITRAARENQILEQFFPTTLFGAKERLPERRSAALGDRSDAAAEFFSKVERHLITFASLAQLLAVIATAVALLLGLDQILGRSRSAAGLGSTPK